MQPIQGRRDALVPVIVALPLFLQNVDSSVLATALPIMATSLRVDTLRLNLAITAYLISLAIFLPASSWLADRLGVRRVFCGAIAVFTLASGLCASANSLEALVAYRVLQGMGGALMVPLARLILLRVIPPAAMVAAMIWFTVPAGIGRLLGPLVGGAMVTWTSWRWIFLINIPLGLVAVALALGFIPADDERRETRAFDAVGFILMGLGLASALVAIEGVDMAALGLQRGHVAALGAACLILYWLHSGRIANPLIDLGVFRYRTFFTATLGSLPLRLAIGAAPFLLPLLLQLGFGLSPLDSGLLTMGTAVGSLTTRGLLTRVVRVMGFRRLLLAGTVGASASYIGYAMLRASTPHPLIFIVLVFSGLVMGMVMITLQTLAFSEIPKPLMGHSTALSSMVQQVSISLGVLFATELLRLAVWTRGGNRSALVAADFSLAYICMAASVLVALVSILRLPHDVGAELRGVPADVQRPAE